jgi:hypothetical protein
MTRSLHLPIIQPRTYGDCVDGTPLTKSLEERASGHACEAYTCRHNLRTVRSENVPGRRNHGIAPEWTFDSEAIASSPSCALDVANRGPHRCSEIAEMEGKSKRRIQQEVKGALLSLKDRGIDTAEFLALIEQERAEERG